MDYVGLIIFILTLIIIVASLIIRIVVVNRRRKKLYSQIEIGSYVITMGGVCGRIIGIKQSKEITYILLQTGDKTHKSYLTMDIESVYRIAEDPKEILRDDIIVDEKSRIAEI